MSDRTYEDLGPSKSPVVYLHVETWPETRFAVMTELGSYLGTLAVIVIPYAPRQTSIRLSLRDVDGGRIL